MTIPFIEPTIEPERWEPPTMKSVLQMDDNPLVPCACGRSVNADMMRVVGDGYACDACHETWFREGTLTREDFARSLGAPEPVILKAQRQDAARTAGAATGASSAALG